MFLLMGKDSENTKKSFQGICSSAPRLIAKASKEFGWLVFHLCTHTHLDGCVCMSVTVNYALPEAEDRGACLLEGC